MKIVPLLLFFILHISPSVYGMETEPVKNIFNIIEPTYKEKIKDLEDKRFLIRNPNFYLKSDKDESQTLDESDKISTQVLMQSKKAIDTFDIYKDITIDVPIFKVVCSQQNVPLLIKVLNANDNLKISRKEKLSDEEYSHLPPLFNEIDSFSTSESIDLINALHDLDLRDEFKEGIFPYTIREHFMGKMSHLKDDEPELLQYLNSDVVKEMIELLQKKPIHKALFEEYCKKLYEQKIKLFLPSYEKICYFNKDLMIYCYHNKLFLKKSNAEPIGYSVLPLLPIYNDWQDKPNYLKEKNPTLINMFWGEGSLLSVQYHEVMLNEYQSRWIDVINMGIDEDGTLKNTILYATIPTNDTAQTIQAIKGKFNTACFASNDALYLGDNKGSIYYFDCDQEQSNSNPRLIEEWQKLGVVAPIVNVSTDKQYNKVIIDTSLGIYEGAQIGKSLSFKELQQKNLNDIFYAKDDFFQKTMISPSGKLFSTKMAHVLKLYDIQTSSYQLINTTSLQEKVSDNVMQQTPFRGTHWTSNSALLVATTNEKIMYIIPCAHDYIWNVEKQKNSNTLCISADGTNIIEQDAGWISNNINMRTLVDSNIEKTLDFLDSSSDASCKRLIGLALLHEVSDYNTRQVPEAYAALYNKYLPQEVKNVFELNVGAEKENYTIPSESPVEPIKSSLFSYFNFADKLESIKKTISDYRYQIFGLATIGLLATYKLWMFKKKYSQ